MMPMTKTMPETHFPDREYTIEAVATPLEQSGLLKRVLFPHGTSHAFMRLTADTADGLRQTLAELHFTAKDKTGNYVPVSSKPLNMMAAIAGYVGLENAFYKAVDAVGLGRSVARLKGIETGDRHKDSNDLHVFGRVSGAPEAMMAAWNRACAAAIEINKANIPFTQLAPYGDGPANCKAGIKTVLRAMGDEFQHITKAFQGERGGDLTTRIPGLQSRLPDAGQIKMITLSSLQSAHRVLAQQLYKTSRMLNGSPQPEQPSSSPVSPLRM